MQLENKATQYFKKNNISIDLSYLKNNLIPDNLLELLFNSIFTGIKNNESAERIAAKFHISLAHYILLVAGERKVSKVVFSGGVFQNQLLVDLIISFMQNDFKLYFHKELSPNDECISFGQLMWYCDSRN